MTSCGFAGSSTVEMYPEEHKKEAGITQLLSRHYGHSMHAIEKSWSASVWSF